MSDLLLLVLIRLPVPLLVCRGMQHLPPVCSGCEERVACHNKPSYRPLGCRTKTLVVRCTARYKRTTDSYHPKSQTKRMDEFCDSQKRRLNYMIMIHIFSYTARYKRQLARTTPNHRLKEWMSFVTYKKTPAKLYDNTTR